MKWSDARGNIAGALARASADLKDPGKDRDVDAGKRGKWAYATLESFLGQCRTALARQECSIVQGMEERGTTWGVVTCIAHASGEWVETFFPFAPRRLTDEATGTVTVQALPSDPQALNSAFSYARRYAILGNLSLVASGEDDDGQAASAAAAGKAPNRAKETPDAKAARQAEHDASWTQEEQRRFHAKLRDLGVTGDELNTYLEKKGHARYSCMPQAKRDALLQFLSQAENVAKVASP